MRVKSKRGPHNMAPGTVDSYPDKDCFIPQACQEADQIAEPKSGEWTRAFMRSMNTILHREGLRVL